MTSKDYIIQITRECLERKCPAVFELDGVGKLLIVGLVSEGDAVTGVWVAVGIPGKALKILDASKPVDIFDLISSGVPLGIAEAVAELVTSLKSPAELKLKPTITVTTNEPMAHNENKT